MVLRKPTYLETRLQHLLILKIIIDKNKDIKYLPEAPTTTTSKPTTTTTTTTTLPAIEEEKIDRIVIPVNINEFNDIKENYNNTIEKYEMIENYNTALSSHHEGFSLLWTQLI